MGKIQRLQCSLNLVLGREKQRQLVDVQSTSSESSFAWLVRRWRVGKVRKGHLGK